MFLNNIHAVTQNTEPNSIVLPDGLLYSQKVLSFGPSYIWPLWETSGLVMEDIVSTYDGSYSGVTLNNTPAPGVSMRNAPRWDGVNDLATVASLPISGAEFSLGVWVKMFDAGVWTTLDYKVCLQMHVDANNRYGILKSNVANTIAGYRIANSVVTERTASLSTLNWFFAMVTGSVSNNRFRFYINSTQQGADMAAGAFTGTTATLYFGRFAASAIYFHNGWLSFATYFPRELTAAEVAQLAVAI